MIIASGVIKVDRLDKVDEVVMELKKMHIEIDDIDRDQIIFIMETDAPDTARCEIEHLRGIDHVKDIYLLFYSFKDR